MVPLFCPSFSHLLALRSPLGFFFSSTSLAAMNRRRRSNIDGWWHCFLEKCTERFEEDAPFLARIPLPTPSPGRWSFRQPSPTPSSHRPPLPLFGHKKGGIPELRRREVGGVGSWTGWRILSLRKSLGRKLIVLPSISLVVGRKKRRTNLCLVYSSLLVSNRSQAGPSKLPAETTLQSTVIVELIQTPLPIGHPLPPLLLSRRTSSKSGPTHFPLRTTLTSSKTPPTPRLQHQSHPPDPSLPLPNPLPSPPARRENRRRHSQETLQPFRPPPFLGSNTWTISRIGSMRTRSSTSSQPTLVLVERSRRSGRSRLR